MLALEMSPSTSSKVLFKDIRIKSGDPKKGLYVNLPADALSNHEVVGSSLDDDKIEASSAAQMKKAYRALVDRFRNSNVSCLLLNVNYQRACFDSQTWDSYGQDDPKLKHLTHWLKANVLIRRKLDHYAVCVHRCREVGLSPWVSLRMSDHHYTSDPYRRSLFLQTNTDCRLGDRFDYTKEKTQQHFLALLEELLSRYDVDGVELDWMRTCPVTPRKDLNKDTELLTEFVRRARSLLDVAAKRRGHPVHLGVRVPSVPEHARQNALDACDWVRQDLVDVLIPSSIFTTTDTDIPVRQWREQIGSTGHQYVIAPAAERVISAFPAGRRLSQRLAIECGFTAAMMHRGADAIYLFNHHQYKTFQFVRPLPDGPSEQEVIVQEDYANVLRHVGKMDTAIAVPRRHILSYHEGPVFGPNPNALPAKIQPEKPCIFSLATGPAAKVGKAILRIGLNGESDLSVALEAKVDGTACKPVADFHDKDPLAPVGRPNGGPERLAWSLNHVAKRMRQFEVPLVALRDGDNIIAVQPAEATSTSIVWVEIFIEPVEPRAPATTYVNPCDQEWPILTPKPGSAPRINSMARAGSAYGRAGPLFTAFPAPARGQFAFTGGYGYLRITKDRVNRQGNFTQVQFAENRGPS